MPRSPGHKKSFKRRRTPSDLTLPNCSKYCFTSSTTVLADNPPTNIFFVLVTICKTKLKKEGKGYYSRLSQNKVCKNRYIFPKLCLIPLTTIHPLCGQEIYRTGTGNYGPVMTCGLQFPEFLSQPAWLPQEFWELKFTGPKDASCPPLN